jgi:hypothetical protein
MRYQQPTTVIPFSFAQVRRASQGAFLFSERRSNNTKYAGAALSMVSRYFSVSLFLSPIPENMPH